MLRRTTKLKYVGLMATALGFGGGILHINDYNLQAFGVVRTARAIATTFSIAVCYKRCGNTDQEWSATHKSAAEQLLALCETNKGVYLKVGQHIGTLDNLLPAEYVQTMRRLNEVTLKVPLADICQIIEQDLRRETTEIFDRIDAEPLHATVLAQVHHAILKGGREVAVKVQHPHLKASSMIDLKTMEFLAGVMSWMFPELKVEWLVTETKAILEQELNLLQQGKSASKVRNMIFKVMLELKVSFFADWRAVPRHNLASGTRYRVGAFGTPRPGHGVHFGHPDR
jgi:aarF domain-containing kinase